MESTINIKPCCKRKPRAQDMTPLLDYLGSMPHLRTPRLNPGDLAMTFFAYIRVYSKVIKREYIIADYFNEKKKNTNQNNMPCIRRAYGLGHASLEVPPKN